MLAIALGLAAIASSTTPSVKAASVTPTVVSGNPSCASLGYAFERKFDPPASGTFTIGNGSITIVLGGQGTLSSFTSTILINAVIMKGGPNANVYAYANPGVLSDTNLVTPTNPSNNQPFGTSHISFCYNNPNPPVEAPTVTKTAAGTNDRTVTWNLTKSVAPTSHSGLAGEVAGTSDWTVVATKIEVLGNYQVTGSITIDNPNLVPINVSVADALNDGTVAAVDCDPVTAGNQSTGTVAAEGQLICTYSASPTGGTATLNTATVTVTTAGIPQPDPATAAVSFIENLIGDDSVTLADARFTYSQLISASKTEVFPETFTCPSNAALYTNGTLVMTETNVATLTGANTNLSAQAAVTVTCTLPPPPEWCSPGYWRNHLDQAVIAATAGGFSLNDTYASQFGSDPARKNKGVADGAPVSPTLLQVLENPQWYSDGAFNAVGDLLSGWHPGVNFMGTRVNNCPLN